MTIATTKNNLGGILNAPLPGQLPSALQQLAFGNLLRQAMAQTLRRCSPNTAAANPYIVGGQSVAEATVPATVPATSPGANLLGQLPDDAKCETILRATAIAGTGTLGSLVVDLQAVNDATNFPTGGTGPVAGHIGVSPSGDIVTATADAWTSIDVTYVPQKVDAAEYNPLSVVAGTGVCALPVAATTQGVVTLMEAESLTGTTVGKFAVLPPSAANPGATKQANLNLPKTQVLFKVTDAVTSARIKVGLVSAVNQNQILEAASLFV